MRTLTVNIDDQSAERSVKAFLDKMGLQYSIDNQSSPYAWWEDSKLVDELNNRSTELRSGKDAGVSFSDVKQQLLKR